MQIAPGYTGEDAAWQLHRLFTDEVHQLRVEEATQADQPVSIDYQLRDLGRYTTDYIRDAARLLVREICMAYPGDVPYESHEPCYDAIPDELRGEVLQKILSDWRVVLGLHYEGGTTLPNIEAHKNLRRCLQRDIAHIVAKEDFRGQLERILRGEELVKPTVIEAAGAQLDRMTISQVNASTGGAMLKPIITLATVRKLEAAGVVCMGDLQYMNRQQLRDKSQLGDAGIRSVERLLLRHGRFLARTVRKDTLKKESAGK